MKTILKFYLFICLSISLSAGCEKNQETNEIEPCNLTEEIKEATDLEGVVYLNSVNNSYAIHVSIDATYDSKDVGFVCNLPDVYKKDGLIVRFTGKYFKYNEVYTSRIPGENYYTLELNRINIINRKSNN